MTRQFRLLGSLLLLTAFASGANTFQAPLVEKSLLLDAATDKATVVVGERGHVIVSTDGGSSYQQRQLPIVTTLTAVDLRDDNIWVAGHDATIMHSADLGMNWEVQLHEPDLQRPFLDILFFDDKHGVASGAYGLFYRTEDGGKTWQSEKHASLLNPLDLEYLNEIRLEDEDFYEQELSSILPHLNRLTRFDDRLYIAGEQGLLAVSDNKGRSWERFDVDYAGSFFDITPVTNDTIMAAGLRGTVYLKSVEGTWQRVNSCTTSTLNTIVKSDNDTLVIVGNNGAVLTVDIPKLLANPDAACTTNGVVRAQLETKSAIATLINHASSMTAVTSDGLQPLVVK
ncbi:WD40/YVTN/BNR-like repeat-containing protein [Alteromonas oceanisediminis]|uniref:WD40/YVTN/BNR-like repeat-containing protein n=1 Tax=Alteromonas oceanisediminis TaxID=2836180 RepID=UPI001BDA7D55|nr:YCF48-related protein [Alteromonas oceanisediminis]MBT0587117.1 hypothetical protein [Alteromonas oceanisediminis]